MTGHPLHLLHTASPGPDEVCNWPRLLADPAHPEREERLEWIDQEDFDPETFDIDTANAILTAQAKRRQPPQTNTSSGP